MKTPLILAAILALGGALWYLTAPPKGLDGYRERAASTAESLRSQVETSRIWVETAADGKATHAATLVGLEEAETDATSAASKFESFEPPAGGLKLRQRFSATSDDVTAALADLRIAAQLERWQEIEGLAEPLPGLAEDLRRFEESVEP
jgi:hypothetical protein